MENKTVIQYEVFSAKLKPFHRHCGADKKVSVNDLLLLAIVLSGLWLKNELVANRKASCMETSTIIAWLLIVSCPAHQSILKSNFTITDLDIRIGQIKLLYEMCQANVAWNLEVDKF